QLLVQPEVLRERHAERESRLRATLAAGESFDVAQHGGCDSSPPRRRQDRDAPDADEAALQPRTRRAHPRGSVPRQTRPPLSARPLRMAAATWATLSPAPFIGGSIAASYSRYASRMIRCTTSASTIRAGITCQPTRCCPSAGIGGTVTWAGADTGWYCTAELS